MKRRLILVVVAMTLAACSSDTGLDIAAKRENLDLAYRKEELAKKPQTIEQIVDEAPPLPGLPTRNDLVRMPSGSGGGTNSFRPLPADRGCRKAPPNAPAVSQTTTVATSGPRPGRYPAHQVGTFELSSGTFNLKGPVPRDTELTIRNVVDESEVNSGGTTQLSITFEEVVPSAGEPTVTTYKITNAELQLVKITNGESTFVPTPAITIMKFSDAAGTNWTSAGVDLDTTEAMTVQGTIESRTTVDLCGNVVEAYRVVSRERRSNSQTGFSYETDPEQPKIYDIATQQGALVIQMREKSTTRFIVNGAPATVLLDYTRTLNALLPAGAR
jgi:hypothetical protein